MKKTHFLSILAILSATGCATTTHNQEPVSEKIVAAYTYYKDAPLPDPHYFNRVHYSYASVDSVNYTDIVVPNIPRLKSIVALKESHPEFKVTLSLGGLPGILSQMTRNDSLRADCVKNCVATIDSLGLDGIDVDWEAPGRGAGCLSVEEDTGNYALFLSQLREALGDEKLITIATSPSGYGVDFEKMIPVIDNFNIMTYDMGTPPYHHSAIHRSDLVEWKCIDDALNTYTSSGTPLEKIVIGVPFYGRGIEGGRFDNFVNYADFITEENVTVAWDLIAAVPYVIDSLGNMIFSFDNPESLAIKCDYILDNNLGGVMTWKYEADTSDGVLRDVLAKKFLPHRFETLK